MRTTIDLPEQLFQRVKKATAERKTTFRALVIDALERSLEVRAGEFRLRDASVGAKPKGLRVLSPGTINRAIEAQKERPFRQ